MARTKGNVPYSGSLEVTIKAPLDARRVVQLKSDLYKDETWRYLGTPDKPDNSLYLYKGLDVIVCGDTDENNGIYVLMNVDGFAQESSWEKKTGSTSITITDFTDRGVYSAGATYMKGDMVGVDGVLYLCLEDTVSGIKPGVDTGWQDKWAVFQLKGSEGKAGEAPYINSTTNEWNILKTDGTVHNFGVKALGENGTTPHIQDGYWYIGTTRKNKATGTSITIQKVGDTYNWFLDGVDSTIQAIGEPGEAAIANINYCGKWNSTTTYTNNNARTGKTDVVLGSDNKMYAALNPTIVGAATNPVNDTTNINWGLFAMYGSDGKTGDTPYIKDGFWYIGTETVTDKTTGLAIRATGSLITISTDGYWEIDGYKTDKPASITTITERQISTTQNVTNIVENIINNINPRGVFDPLQTYYHTNVAEENKTDVVVGSDGRGYFCLVEGTSVNPVGDTTDSWALFSIAGSPGTAPNVELRTENGHQYWYIDGNPQHVRADGIDGQTIAGTNGRDPYIRENGMWAFQRLSNDGKKTVIEELETTIKAEVDQPNIREGMWFVGDTPTFVQAKGENAIANINFREAWKVGEQYWNKNASVNNWTDLVEGADDNKYYCKVNHTASSANNPCIEVDGVWVRNTSTEATSKWGKWSIKGSTGADGKNIELRWFEEKLQWRPVGTSTWNDLMNSSDLRNETLSDISTPIGSVLMFSGKAVNIPTGYLLANGDTIQKTEYPELVEVLSGSNVATSASLPDLRGRFVVGYVDGTVYDPTTKGPATDYDTIGETGGTFEVKLTAKQSGLPEHTHEERIADNTGSGYLTIHESNLVSAKDPFGSSNWVTEKTGGGVAWEAKEAHENRPPYYVLAYIVKASYIGDIKTPYDTYLQTVPAGVTPLNPEEWLETMKGQTGIAGINPRGNYSNTTPYYDHDTVVIVNPLNPEIGNTFACTVEAEAGITGVEPGVTAGWENSWARLVLRGAKGDDAKEVLVRYSATESTASLDTWHAIPTVGDKYIRFSTNGTVEGLGIPMLVKGDKGDNALPIKLQYSTDGTTWSDTAAATSKYIRFGTYSNEGVLSWSSTISISGGSSVFTSNIQVNLPENRYFGKYRWDAEIPSANKTFEQVLNMIAVESIPPTVSISASISGGIPYNDSGLVDRNIVVNMSATSKNSGANWTGTTAKRQLWYKRVGDATWIELKNQPGNSDIASDQTTYTHNVKDLLAVNNVKGFEYKFKATDSTGATAETGASTAVTPAGYAAPTYSITTPFAYTKEKGNVAQDFTGTISQTAQNGVRVLSYEIQYKMDGGAWTQLKLVNYANAPTMPIVLSGVDNSTIVNTIKEASNVQYQLLVTCTSATTNQVATIGLGTTTLLYNWYATTSSITTMTAQTPMVTASSVVISSMVAESGSNKQSIEFPPSWGTITKLEQFNTLSNAWDVILLSTFTETSVNKTIQGVVRSYKKYTHNGALIGARQLRWTV